MTFESGAGVLVRTKALSPSKMALALQCPLRYLLETEHEYAAPIPESLGSCLGRAAHETIHYFATGDAPPTAEEIRAHLIDSFMRCALAADMTKWILDALAVPRAVTSLISMADFIDKVRLTTRAAKSTGVRQGKRGWRVEAAGPATSQGPSSPKRIYGIEVPLNSEMLDLSGRADLVERQAHGVMRITDFKTGFMPEDGPTLQNLVQVCAYALIQSEHMPETEMVVRIVSANGEWERPFSKDLATQATQVLRAVCERLPRGVKLQPDALASPGDVCTHCRFRPSCSIYRARIDSDEWNGDIAKPFDAWGTVEQIHCTSKTLLDIRLRVAAGRSVHIVNVPAKALDGVRIGAHCEAFGLASLEVGRGIAAPCNFYIADGGRSHRSAFSSYVGSTLR